MTRHNWKRGKGNKIEVVNCFQKLLSSWHDTTLLSLAMQYQSLWIAFKNYYLRDTTQLSLSNNCNPLCCELLSKIIIFVTRHNRIAANKMGFNVVNCFQKLLSSWHDTTCGRVVSFPCALWIAFKNYYLRDTTQLSELLALLDISCELLSKIIIFVTRHNWNTLRE